MSSFCQTNKFFRVCRNTGGSEKNRRGWGFWVKSVYIILDAVAIKRTSDCLVYNFSPLCINDSLTDLAT